MKSIDARRPIYRNVSLFPDLNRKIEPTLKDKRVLECCALPPFRQAVDDPGVLAAWETEPDKPLPVKLPRCVFQQLHPPPIVLDQIVIGRKNISDPLLDWTRWWSELEVSQNLRISVWLRSTANPRLNEVLIKRRFNQTANKTWVSNLWVNSEADKVRGEDCIYLLSNKFCIPYRCPCSSNNDVTKIKTEALLVGIIDLTEWN
jgi:hypothetical protein